jgi:hypothetical protein
MTVCLPSRPRKQLQPATVEATQALRICPMLHVSAALPTARCSLWTVRSYPYCCQTPCVSLPQHLHRSLGWAYPEITLFAVHILCRPEIPDALVVDGRCFDSGTLTTTVLDEFTQTSTTTSMYKFQLTAGGETDVTLGGDAYIVPGFGVHFDGNGDRASLDLDDTQYVRNRHTSGANRG